MKQRDFHFWLSRVLNHPLVSPDAIQIPLTYKCNLRCKMCDIHSGSDVTKELSTQAIFEILNQAKEMGIKEVVLTGGEPFLRNDWFKVCEHCHALGLRSIITTNGTFITKDLARRIIQSKVGHVHFSLDGLMKNHDFVRGEGNFEFAENSIRIIHTLRKENNYQPSLGIACTVMNNNVSDLPGLLAFADSLGVDVITFQPLLKSNSNTSQRGDSDFWVSGNMLGLLDENIEKIKSFHGKHTKVYEEPNLKLLSKYYRKDLSMHDWKCFGGYKTVFICIDDDEKGSPLVYTCHGVCGNLTEMTLKKCWVSSEARRLRKQAKRCKSLCLQSCYSRINSESIITILRPS